MDQSQDPNDANANATEPTPVVSPVQTESPTPKKPVNKKLWIILGVVSLLVISACVVWWVSSRGNEPKASTQPSLTEQKTVEKQQESDPELARFIEPTTGEKWFETPKPIANQGYLTVETPEYYGDTDPSKLAEAMKSMAPVYSEIGTRGGNTIVMALAQGELGGPYPQIFERSEDGKVTYIALPSASMTLDDNSRQYQKEALTKKVAVFDETVHYDSLTVPAKLNLENGEHAARTQYGGIGHPVTPLEGVTKSLMATLGESKLYRVEKAYSDTKLTNISYEISLPVGLTVSLDYQPNTLSLEKYTWTNGDKPTVVDYRGVQSFDTLAGIARGCGGTTNSVTRSDELKVSDLVAVGKTDKGREVYMPKDPNATLLIKAYEEYVQFNEYDKSIKVVSKEEFIKRHGLVLIKNNDNQILAYARQSLAPAYGCAKPVIYLYPTKPTVVNVRVGADVKVSEPLYPSSGWTVTAQPNGQLSYMGATYGSLFWEGPGHGEYPGITKGTIVKRADAETVIRKQLVAQNLNKTEIADFMEFWSDRIPNKPYIRLTWLNTAQLDALAPLYVTPKPDTTIRVFLDMAGYDAPISIAPQKLHSTPRKGFTLVEWGGLAPSSSLY